VYSTNRKTSEGPTGKKNFQEGGDKKKKNPAKKKKERVEEGEESGDLPSKVWKKREGRGGGK